MNSDLKVWINGKMIARRDATVPILSHGFSRGSAIFDVLGVHPGPNGPMAFRLDDHLARLMKSAELLGMELAYSTEEIIEAIKATVKANGIGRGIIKILAYWGEEAITDLVLDARLDVAVFAIPESEELVLDKQHSISACVARWRKLHPETVPVGAKACANYLNGYLARKDAVSRGFDIGILLGTDGFLAEGSTESVFIVKDGVLMTPPVGRILSSITRLSVLEAVPEIGIPVVERPITADEISAADEIFTVHTGTKVEAVARFEDRQMEAPGPVTDRVMKLINDIMQFKDERFMNWFQPLT
ncbi:MAG: aminotransferase class IV [Deltaproteobacteria bacterium]|nr:aminotransferase class IV [Deltaproteobacteria bacterium]